MSGAHPVAFRLITVLVSATRSAEGSVKEVGDPISLPSLEFLTLQNPATTSLDVVVRLYLANTITTEQVVTVGPQTRVTLDINSMVLPIVRAAPRAGNSLSIAIQAANSIIMAERPMYFNFHNIAQGGTDVVGYSG